MTLRDLYEYCVEKANEIHSFYDLAEMEVEDGGSVEHECELAIEDINQLIQE